MTLPSPDEYSSLVDGFLDAIPQSQNIKGTMVVKTRARNTLNAFYTWAREETRLRELEEQRQATIKAKRAEAAVKRAATNAAKRAAMGQATAGAPGANGTKRSHHKARASA